MSEVRKRQQLNLRELYQINWFLGAGLALLALWPVYTLDFTVVFHFWLATSLIAISAIRPQITTYFPKPVWNVIPFFLVALLGVDLYLSSEVVPALVRLNIFLVLYRCLSFRRKREDLQLIVLCLFLVIIAGVRTVAVTFVLQVVIFTAVAMAFLFNITLMEDSRDTITPRSVWADFTWSRFLRKLWARCDSGFMMVAGLAFSSIVVFSSLMFLLIPRFDLNTALPFLDLPRASQTGFSEDIRFGDVTNIRNNNRVALRIEVDSPDDIPADPYWRMLVLDEYRNGGFRMSQALKEHERHAKNVRRITYNGALIGESEPPDVRNLWTFYMEGGIARYLPLTGRFEGLRLQETRDITFVEATHTFSLPRVNSGLLVYQVENMEFSGVYRDEHFGMYSLDYNMGWGELGGRSRFQYFNYPDTTMVLPRGEADVAYLEELVEIIGRGEALTAAEFARRATQYLQSRHSYSMSYSLPMFEDESDHVVRWLKSGSPGHCEVFAGALILICRTAGIPARAVTGFRGGSWNTFENYFMVRNADAHAWVEIFDGRDSWLRFDPTPGGESVGDYPDGIVNFGGMQTDSSLAAYLDSFRIIWYRRIVSFDQDTQVRIWTTIQESFGRIALRERINLWLEAISLWWQSPWDLQRFFDMIRVVAGAAVFGLLIVFCFRQDRMSLFRIKPNPMDPVRRRAGRYLQRLRELGPPPADNEDFGSVVADLERLRYGPLATGNGWREVIRQARRLARRESRRQRRGVPSPG